MHRILPSIMKECVNKDMVPFILPSIIVISEQATEKEFAKLILPGLIPIFKIQEPVQVSTQYLTLYCNCQHTASSWNCLRLWVLDTLQIEFYLR